MSVVTVQLGQCGNQVGHELFEVLYNDAHDGQRKSYCAASCERFFHRTFRGELQARAVLVDMEPKVVRHSLTRAARSGRWSYAETSHFSQQQGSGNNWANGYCVHGPRHGEVLEELVRREAERCDRLAGLVPVMSVAGGTGSGVGTYVTQRLKDSFPKSFILNHLTWPYSSGEVIVQNYNSVLTLAKLYDLSDAVVVHENDAVHRICSQLLNIKNISFSDVNRVIAHQLGAVLQPALSSSSYGSYSRNPLGELVSAVACHSEYKLLSVCTIPQMRRLSLAFSAFTWPGLLKHLRQMLVSNAKMEEGVDWQVRPPSDSERTRSHHNFNRSLANLLIVRGKDVFSADTGVFSDSELYSSWLSSDEAFSVWKSTASFNRYEKCATLLSNSQSLLRPLENIVRKAWDMFSSRAYVHHYTKHGISEEDFLSSFTALEQVISSYRQL